MKRILKRLLALTLILTLVIAALAACDDGGDHVNPCDEACGYVNHTENCHCHGHCGTDGCECHGGH